MSQETIDGGEEFGGREFAATGRGAQTTKREIAPCRRQQARQTRPSTSARGIRASRSLDATRRFGAEGEGSWFVILNGVGSLANYYLTTVFTRGPALTSKLISDNGTEERLGIPTGSCTLKHAFI